MSQPHRFSTSTSTVFGGVWKISGELILHLEVLFSYSFETKEQLNNMELSYASNTLASNMIRGWETLYIL